MTLSEIGHGLTCAVEVLFGLNWLFWLLLAFVVAFLAHQQWWVRRGVTHVSVHDIKAFMESRQRFFLVDVREPGEFASGHLPLAVNVPLGRLAIEAENWERNRDIMLVCATGRRSVIACRQLQAMGFTAVRNVEGGIRRWPWGTV